MIKKKAFGLAALLSIMLLTIPTAFACPPGLSPGFWRHECRAYFGQGALHYTRGELETFAWYINDRIPPGHPLKALDGDPDTFSMMDAYLIFTDNTYKAVWLPLANLFNEAAGLGPYYND